MGKSKEQRLANICKSKAVVNLTAKGQPEDQRKMEGRPSDKNNNKNRLRGRQTRAILIRRRRVKILVLLRVL